MKFKNGQKGSRVFVAILVSLARVVPVRRAPGALVRLFLLLGATDMSVFSL